MEKNITSTLENLHLSLIEGSFSAEEAKEILLKIYGTKVNFHQRKNLSDQERFGESNATAEKRIPVLYKNIEDIKVFTEYAKTNNLKININSQINLSVEQAD